MVELATCWIGAERALRHVERNRIWIERTFERYSIGKSQYAIYAGFDEWCIQERCCFLEQILIFTVSTTLVTSPLLAELGRLLSPFTSTLITKSSAYPLPVYKNDGTLWEIDEFLAETASRHLRWHGSPAATHPTVISLSRTSNDESQEDSGSGDTGNVKMDVSKGGEEKGKGIDKDDGSGVQNPGDYRARDDERSSGHPTNQGNKGLGDPSPDEGTRETTKSPKIAFEIGSRIYSSANGDLSKSLQGINTRGKLRMKMSSDSMGPTCQVRFTELQFENKILTPDVPPSYHQFHCRVTVDSCRLSRVSDDKPLHAFGMHMEPMVTVPPNDEDRRRYFRASRSQIPDPNINVTGGYGRVDEEDTSAERKRFNSKIEHQYKTGIAWWGFTVDEPDQQDGGTILDGPVLPTATFHFRIPLDKNIPRVPKSIDVELMSYWSIIPLQTATSYSNMVSILCPPTSSTDSPVPQYFNLCQMTALNIPSDLKRNSNYCATLHVETTGKRLHSDPGVLHPGSESVHIKNKIRGTDDNPFKYGDASLIQTEPFMGPQSYRSHLLFSDNMWIGPSPQQQRDAKQNNGSGSQETGKL